MKPTILKCDNQSSIKLAHDPIYHARTKHIEIQHHFVTHMVLYHSLMPLDQNLIASRISFQKTMESTVWNKLPGDLQILVLVRLPLLDIRRLSFTCKYFHSLLSDPSFAIHYDRHRLGHPTFFVASLRLQKHMHQTVLNSVIWQEGRNVTFPWQTPLFDYLHGSCWWPSSYGDGFVCFQGFLGPFRNEK
jgi:hypothetical protein